MRGEAMADEPNLPTEGDIARLPRWARVAFAARCARRVLPLFGHKWPDLPARYRAPVVRAVELGERSAARGIREDDGQAITQAAVLVYIEIDKRGDAVSAFSAAVAGAAICAARAAADEGTSPPADICEEFRGVMAASNAGGYVGAMLEGPIRTDFGRIRSYASDLRADDSTPFPPGVFGPLWPDGPPSGWPTDPEDDFKLVIRAVAEPGVTAETVRKHAVELFKALNEYSLEKYGRRLTKDRFRRLVLEHTGAVV